MLDRRAGIPYDGRHGQTVRGNPALSCAEAAETYGITRQGVHDLIRRCGKTLAHYEETLGLVRKFLTLKTKAKEIRELTEDPRIRKLADEIMEEL